MKASIRLGAVFGILMMSGAALAAPIDLGAVMKDMANTLTRISQQSTDASKNAESAQLCDELSSDIATARTVMPPKVGQLPQDQQGAQMTQYQSMIDQLATQVAQLKTDFVANNNAAVAQDLTSITKTKLAGHKAFKGN